MNKNNYIILLFVWLTFLLSSCGGGSGGRIGGGSPLQPAGTPDLSYGVSGKSTLQNGSFNLNGAALQPDGKSVLAGSSIVSGSNQFALSRVNMSGSLDTAFGSNGFSTTSFGNSTNSYFVSLTIQPDNNVIAAGTAEILPGSVLGSGTFYVVARYLPNGSLDSSFGTNGIVNSPNASNSGLIVNAVALQSTGKILLAVTQFIASNKPPSFDILRFNSNGTLDITFSPSGFGGLSVIPFQFGRLKPIVVQPDDKFLVGGALYVNINRSCALVRYNADGTPDLNFSNGMVIPFSSSADCFITSVAVQLDGKILVVAQTSGQSLTGSSYLAVARFNSVDGSLDNSFGNQGVVNIPVGTVGSDFAPDIVVQKDGKILVSWSSYILSSAMFTLSSSTLARLLPDGNIDIYFGTNGMITDAGPYSNTANRGVLIQNDSKIISFGTSFDNPISPASFGQSTFFLSRYWP
ncbi:MAG: hypothetical protein HY202_04230 [Nitrospirae bacterium]|nr:hypothetical protein [Nitrospirota bacterium]